MGSVLSGFSRTKGAFTSSGAEASQIEVHTNPEVKRRSGIRANEQAKIFIVGAASTFLINAGRTNFERYLTGAV